MKLRISIKKGFMTRVDNITAYAQDSLYKVVTSPIREYRLNFFTKCTLLNELYLVVHLLSH